MKKSNLIFAALLTAIYFNQNKVYSQATSAPGTNLPTTAIDYLGWANGASGTLTNPQLDVKNEEDMPIIFYTNAGTTTYNNKRMIIDKGANGGFIGIGHNFTAPVSLLHQAKDVGGTSASANYHQFTNYRTGHASGNGLLVGIDANGNAIFNNQYPSATVGYADMQFYTSGAPRMTIIGNT